MRRYHSHTGRNCLQCCIAGLFDMSLDEVPDVDTFDRDADGKGWFHSFYEWSKTTLHHIPVSVTDDTLDDLIHIEVIENYMGVCHAIISKGENMLHDPDSAHNAGPERATDYRILFVPLNTGVQKRQVDITEFLEDEPEK